VGKPATRIGLYGRQSLTSLNATKLATKMAYDMAQVKPGDIDLAEVHDCFTFAELMLMRTWASARLANLEIR